MKTYIDKFLIFLKGIFSSTDPTSSKRFFGAIGYISAIVFIALWQKDLIETLLYVSAMLIGLDTVTNLIGKFKKDKP